MAGYVACARASIILHYPVGSSVSQRITFVVWAADGAHELVDVKIERQRLVRFGVEEVVFAHALEVVVVREPLFL